MIKITEKVKERILREQYDAYLQWCMTNRTYEDGIKLIFKSCLVSHHPGSAEPVPLQYGQYCMVMAECSPFYMRLNMALREKLAGRPSTLKQSKTTFQKIKRLFKMAIYSPIRLWSWL